MSKPDDSTDSTQGNSSEKEGESNETPNREDVMGQATKYTLGNSITPESFEDVLSLSDEIANKISYENLVFILGSFQDGKKTRLLSLQEQINTTNVDSRAVLMDEFTNVEPIMKFRLIAHYSDRIIGICENDTGGFTLEQGIIVTKPDLFKKTHILKREYGEEEEKDNFSWMQSTGVFRRFEKRNRLWRWANSDQLEIQTQAIVNTLKL